MPHGEHLLTRMHDSQIPVWENPEWQAFALAGHIAMPKMQVLKLQDRSPEAVGAFFGVSASFARNHLKRCKIHMEPSQPQKRRW